MNRGELARFQRMVTIDPTPNSHVETPCWLWKGRLTPNGYPRHRLAPGQRERMAHRISYEHYVGPIPDGLQLDHLCRVRRCVNAEHLEPVTPSENTLRQDHAERRKTECPSGHPYTEDNTARRGGKRFCLTCDRDRKRK